MIAPITRSFNLHKLLPKILVPATVLPLVVALFSGLAIGSLFHFISADFPQAVSVALWALGMALGMISTALYWQKSHNDPQWGLLMSGQFVGLVAGGLLIVAAA